MRNVQWHGLNCSGFTQEDSFYRSMKCWGTTLHHGHEPMHMLLRTMDSTGKIGLAQDATVTSWSGLQMLSAPEAWWQVEIPVTS